MTPDERADYESWVNETTSHGGFVAPYAHDDRRNWWDKFKDNVWYPLLDAIHRHKDPKEGHPRKMVPVPAGNGTSLTNNAATITTSRHHRSAVLAPRKHAERRKNIWRQLKNKLKCILAKVFCVLRKLIHEHKRTLTPVSVSMAGNGTSFANATSPIALKNGTNATAPAAMSRIRGRSSAILTPCNQGERRKNVWQKLKNKLKGLIAKVFSVLHKLTHRQKPVPVPAPAPVAGDCNWFASPNSPATDAITATSRIHRQILLPAARTRRESTP